MAPERTLTVRRAQARDAATLGSLGAALMHLHFAFDPQRFLSPGEHADRGYASFLRAQLDNEDAAIFVAEIDERIIGYVFAGLEPRSWKELRGPAGFIHDIVVEERARGSGAGRALVDAAIAWLRDRGAPRVLLCTAEQNQGAQRLFERLGFRRTMIEMTREL
ncbi:MAG TPA: GNAT family N-acetyltransferase [Vicinamibacterales bacterium]|nr:GNAT family N-acetyltransferase [Vicinamibacterales bacterium]